MVYKVQKTKEKPHGLDYSLTLHDADGRRILGFDNAHPVAIRKKKADTNDHKHLFLTIKPYHYQDAETLLIDFWKTVDHALKDKGEM